MTEVRIVRFGGPEVFRAIEKPSPGLPADHVRIRVSAAGINFADVQMRMGLYPEAPRLPFAPGFEVAGVISEVAPGVSGLRLGERVLAMCRFGGYATEIVLPAAQVRKTPRRLTDVEAASIPVSFTTAWIALMEMARVREGDRVLVPGAAGGVGSAIVQVASRVGAQVVGLVSTAEKKEIVHTLGAGQVHTYTEFAGRTGPEVREFDIVLDARGGAALKDYLRRLAPAGRAVSYGVSSLVSGEKRSILHTVLQLMKTPLLTSIGLQMSNRGLFGLNMLKLLDSEKGMQLFQNALDSSLAGFQDGAFRTTVGKVFPLSEAGPAHSHLQSRKNYGKVVLRCV
jgi:NADPH:quinone reductase-like Zn-dependent oxidoreductase